MTDADILRFAQEGAKELVLRVFETFPKIEAELLTRKGDISRSSRKKLHWTQTAAGRAKLSKAMKQRRKKR